MGALPSIRPKLSALGQTVICTSLPVASLLIHLGSPPAEPLHETGVDEAKEDNDDAEREPGVKRRAQRHRVLGPPGLGSVLDEVVEDVADDGPDGKVEARGGGDPAERAEQHGQVYEADDAALALARVQPQRDGQDGADGEGPDQGPVGGAAAEELAGADDAPQDGAVEVHAGDGAGKAVDGLRGADARHVLEHPVEDGNLGEGADDGGDHLDAEEDPGWDFHVVTELEVGGELDTLCRRDVAVGDKDHVGDGASGENGAGDQLADQVNAAVLICDGHDDADGDKENAADSEGK